MKISEIISYNIPRKLMPQLTANNLAGVFDYKLKLIDPRTLTPSQSERKYITKKINLKNAKPIIVDREGRIINGHHRWDAYLDQGIPSVQVIIVAASFDDIINHFSSENKEYSHNLNR